MPGDARWLALLFASLLLMGCPSALPFRDLVVTGQFSADASQIVDGTLSGYIEVSALAGACYVFTCQSCPTGVGDCVTFAVTEATWNDTGTGPLDEVR